MVIYDSSSVVNMKTTMCIIWLIVTLVDVSLAYVPNPTAGYTYSKLSNFGKKFYFGVANAGYNQFPREDLKVFVMLQTFSSERQEVLVRATSMFEGESNKSVFIRREELGFYDIKALTPLTPPTVKRWTRSTFSFESYEEFQLTAFIEKNEIRLKSFLLVPETYWATEYYFFSILGEMAAWIISSMPNNDHRYWCNRQQHWVNHTERSHYQFILDRVCTVFSGYPTTRGIYFKLQHPAALITHDINENVGGVKKYCDDKDNLVGQENILPNAVLGTEFITIFNEVATFRPSLLILTVHNNTEFKVYTTEDTFESYTEPRALNVYEIVVTQEGSLMVSTKPVMVQAVMRPTCTTPADAMFDFAYTYLLPWHLYFNEYLVGNPSISGVASRVKIIIRASSVDHLSNNDRSLKNLIIWKDVLGKKEWKIGLSDVTPGMTNHIKSNTFFACYIFNSGKRKGDVHPAGYRTCGSDCQSPNQQPEVRRAASTSKGSRNFVSEWLTFQTLIELYFFAQNM